MRPIMDAAKVAHRESPRRIVFAEGEHPYILQAAYQVIVEGIARPILVGRRENIMRMLPHLGLRMRPEWISTFSIRRRILASRL